VFLEVEPIEKIFSLSREKKKASPSKAPAKNQVSLYGQRSFDLRKGKRRAQLYALFVIIEVGI
jgi:hypothetical protein